MPIGLKGNTDGSGAVQIGGSDAITISTGLNTTFAGTVTASGGVLYPLTSGTAIASTSGTALDFTNIPSWVKRITVMFDSVSTNGTSPIQIQLGDAGGVETTGYTNAASWGGSGNTSYSTTGLSVLASGVMSAGSSYSGVAIIVLLGSNTWCETGTMAPGSSLAASYSAGSKALSDTLDRVRITTVGGTDTFDAGSINLLWE
jgi:hypothetical protein